MFHGIPPPRDQDDDDDDELCGSSPSSGDSDEDSPLTDFREEAVSQKSPRPLAKTTSLPLQFDAKGPLCELSSLMAQLPIKRGLSNYYEGKSQSYSSLSDVRCLEDLPKKETPYNRRKMKSGKSCGGGGPDGSPTSNQAPGTCSKTVSKKASRGSCAAAASVARSGSKPPSIPTQKNLCLR